MSVFLDWVSVCESSFYKFHQKVLCPLQNIYIIPVILQLYHPSNWFKATEKRTAFFYIFKNSHGSSVP